MNIPKIKREINEQWYGFLKSSIKPAFFEKWNGDYSIEKVPLLTLVFQNEILKFPKPSEGRLPFVLFKFLYKHGNELDYGFILERDGFIYLNFKFSFDDLELECCIGFNRSTKQWALVRFSSVSTNQVPREVSLSMQAYAKQILGAFSYFYMESGMHVARVTKSDLRRTTHFYQKHEYWTVVPRVHPANNAEVTSGSEVVMTDEQIKRCAHHRRAHYRILRSERYKNARNKKIFVKSCWVGPEEWREGNQIYRIQPNSPLT